MGDPSSQGDLPDSAAVSPPRVARKRSDVELVEPAVKKKPGRPKKVLQTASATVNVEQEQDSAVTRRVQQPSRLIRDRERQEKEKQAVEEAKALKKKAAAAAKKRKGKKK